MNVLITSASRKVALVRAFQDAMRRIRPEGQVIAVDASPRAPALYLADAGHVVPRTDAPHFLSFVVEFCLEHAVKLIIPTRDEELPFFAEHTEIFLQQGICVMIASGEVIRCCLDKSSFLQFCADHGFAVPKVWATPDWSNPAIYPVFVRPSSGKGGRGARKVNSQSELGALIDNRKEILVQEYVDAQEYTVDLFADFNGKVISVVPRRRLQVWGGESFITATENNGEIIQESARLAKEIGLVGQNTIQCFLRDGKPMFIEINPRFGGATSLSIRAGADSPSYLLRLLRGETLEPCLGQFTNHLTMLRYVEDLFLLPDELIQSFARDKSSSF
jgi:carbamoyl-phosphate synthase large subunit